MNIKFSEIQNFISSELYGWGKYERIIFPLIILFVIALSFITNDNKIALLSAIFGISYTILAGKGKISCYFAGLLGTFCYAYISFKNAFWGNLLLYICYCMPMQIVGIFKWKSHLNAAKHEIYKTTLSKHQRIIYGALSFMLICILYCVLFIHNDASPMIDAVTTVLSVLGLLLTVKRCMEQWYVWAVVNFLSAIMWIAAYINGSNCLATVLMWTTYFFLGLYFMYRWKKEIYKVKVSCSQ